jgi:hypothetical protein
MAFKHGGEFTPAFARIHDRAEQVKRFDGLLGKANNSPRRQHGTKRG